jgi:serine/threonine-protein kinase
MGTALLRRYVLVGPIGRGGVSQVYQAVDITDPRPLAIKLLEPTHADNPRAREKIRREAVIAQRLHHPSVPKVYDFGDAPLPDGTVSPYLSMELLVGVALSGKLAGGPLPWPDAVRIAATAADVLAVAHRRGVVHRDLTPGNIMLTQDGTKVIDFGLACPVESAPPAATAEDVQALGAVLYEMLTGHSPYLGGTPRAFLGATRVGSAPPAPVLLVPGLPREVAEICRGCLAKQPGDRPDSRSVSLTLWSVLDQLGPVPLPAPAAVPTYAPDNVLLGRPAGLPALGLEPRNAFSGWCAHRPG